MNGLSGHVASCRSFNCLALEEHRIIKEEMALDGTAFTLVMLPAVGDFDLQQGLLPLLDCFTWSTKN